MIKRNPASETWIAVCDHCGHEVECITVDDGTTYKPTGWIYDNANDLAVCGNCWRSGVTLETVWE